MNSSACYSLTLVLGFVSTSANAEWTQLANDTHHEAALYIDKDSVKQTGPMAIYRQIHVFDQGPMVRNQALSSKLSVYEYDCMNSKLRVLQTSGFSAAWAMGEKVELRPPAENLYQWQVLPNNALGKIMLDMLCPSSKDD